MLSENAIDNLVQPIVERQEAINTYVLTKIARSIRDIGSLSPSDINRMQILVQYGTDIREMNSELARMSGKQVKDIKAMIKEVAVRTNMDTKPLYDYRHKSFIPYEKNAKLKQMVRVVGERTAESYRNISHSRATGFMIRNPKYPGTMHFQSIEETYQSVIDEAIQAVSSGVVDFRTAMRKTIRQLADSGIRRLSWESGYTQRLDTAVRRNLLEGVRFMQQATEDAVGEEVGANGKELSVHINCALDHEPFQGHQFTNEEWEKLQNSESFIDVNGQRFGGVERIIGMWNCRHVARSIIVGVTQPLYTPEKLQKFIDDNHKGYVLPNGKRITMYECTQMQRQMETRIRYAKDEQLAFEAAGNKEDAIIAKQKVKRLTQQYKDFSKDCGLPIHKDKAAVVGYHA